MNRCIKCGCEFVPMPTSEDYEDGVFHDREEDNICESCWQDEFEEENTCPIHHITNMDGFCEACIEENKDSPSNPRPSGADNTG